MRTEDNDSVGYGKPPKEHRFKRGKSGNPKGRPKGSTSLAAAITRAMRERIVIVENGRRRTISKGEAVCKQVTNRALSGEPSSIRLFFQTVQWIGPSAEQQQSRSQLDERDEEVMRGLLNSLNSIEPGDEI